MESLASIDAPLVVREVLLSSDLTCSDTKIACSCLYQYTPRILCDALTRYYAEQRI